MFTMIGDNPRRRSAIHRMERGLFGAIADVLTFSPVGELMEAASDPPEPPDPPDPPEREDLQEAAQRERRRSQGRRGGSIPGRSPTILGSGTFAPSAGGGSGVGQRTLLGGA